MRTYAIYGDNIVECERMLLLLQRAFKASSCSVSGTGTAPTFVMDTPSGQYKFHVYPGFCRWEYDIIAAMRDAGGILRETPDVFITSVENNKETPVLAIEFCSALPAGNQAWQRSGRAYSTARSGIPYLFVTEIGGYELDANREKKAPRLPNPAVPFSYIAYAIESKADVMIAYEMNPGADDVNRRRYANNVAGGDLLNFITATLTNRETADTLASLGKKVFSFVCATSDGKKAKGSSLNNEQWKDVFQSLVREKSSAAIYRNFSIPWKKKLSIEIKPGFRKFLTAVEEFAIAAGSGDLPFCVIKKDSVPRLMAVLKQVYPRLFDLISDDQFGQSDIAICWINGFKPRGDDARPDRGLLPLLRMLVGDKMPILTIVYGPATKPMITKLKSSPRQLAEENGLWEAVLALSNFVICDSMRVDNYVCQRGWGDQLARSITGTNVLIPANSSHFPKQSCLGENDVDSVIHMLFAHALKGKCFESMCNPPGGDWSGISLMFGDNEYRWLTLPRVSASGSKRPDHVIQINDCLVVTIESKDYLRNLEAEIGPRLNQYCIDLFSSQPSCVRPRGGEWCDHTNNFRLPELTYFSIGAFLEASYADRTTAIEHANTDAIFLISFSHETAIIRIKFRQNCNQIVKDLLSRVTIPEGLKIKVEILG